jgi:ACS family tartrate transporter-like MFS transporter
MSELSPFSAKAYGPSPRLIHDADVSGAQGAWRVERSRLMRYLIALYLACVLDQGNLRFASFSMNEKLGLTLRIDGIGVGIRVPGDSLFALPGILRLARHGAHVTLTFLAILFGILIKLLAYIRGPYRFYAMRALPDVAEAGLRPGVLQFLLIGLPAAVMAHDVSGNPSLLIPRPLRSSVCDR